MRFNEDQTIRIKRCMDFSIATLLANFTDDKLVAPKVLEKKLGCQDDTSLRKFQIILDALEKIGVLVKERGKYRRVYEEGVVEAKLRCSSKGFCFAIQDTEGSEDIYIRECHLSSAWNGDRVLVKVIKEGSRRRSPEGEVKLILERANPSVLARLKQVTTQAGDALYKAVPLDDRLLFELDVQRNGISLDEAVDALVHVEVVRYPLGATAPLGRVAQVLGSDAEDANDLDIVCCKHDLPRSFSETVLKEAKGAVKALRKSELKNREDLRDFLTLTFKAQSIGLGEVDQASQHEVCDFVSAPVEHAFTLETLPNGNWRLGVHIVDVTHYAPMDSAVDREARRRGNAIFLGDKVIPMLPSALSENRCSLTPEEDRLTISVLIILNPQGEVLEFEIQPSVIQVDYQLTPETAQGILDRTEDSALGPILDQFYALWQVVQKRRQQRGAIQLNLPDTQYGVGVNPFDDEGTLGVLVANPRLSPQGMVTEFMLLANEMVADHLQALQVPAIYRIQPKPELEEVDELVKLAENLNITMQLQDVDDVTSLDYQRFTQHFVGLESERVLTYLMQETLKPASYSSHPGLHFGLALVCYTHCTSPTQRYADLLVQRILHAVFEHGRDRRTTRAKESVNLRHSSCHGQISWNVLPPDAQAEIEEQLSGLVGHLSDRERVAQEAQEDLAGLKKAGAMKERTGETFPGLITGVQSYGFFVEIEELLVEGLVHVSSLKDDWYEYRSRQQTLVGRKNRKQYRLGDRVEVQVKSVDYYRQQIDLVAVSGGSEATNGDYEEPERSHYHPYLDGGR
jgi:ribonuclease R